jgi:archaetidylinositol phosphate synthase
LDKVSEIVIYLGIALGGLASPILCIAASASSVLVSYTRARAESLGVDLKGIGIAEKAERLLIVAIIAMVPVTRGIEFAVVIVFVISAITVYQRIQYTTSKLQ